jgi:hypothetical protein
VLAELRRLAGDATYDGKLAPAREVRPERRGSSSSLALYGVDAIVRRAPALQRTRAALDGAGQGIP